jgi:predicted nucleic acid-binding protein
MAEHNNSSLADVSCYFLAHETTRPLLTGDGRLRKQAQKDGLEVHGALWLLDRLVEHAVIPTTRAADCLESMLLKNARLPHAECQIRLQQWRA